MFIVVGITAYFIHRVNKREMDDTKWVYHRLLDLKEECIDEERKDRQKDIEQLISWYEN
jgi:hypothetical protein